MKNMYDQIEIKQVRRLELSFQAILKVEKNLPLSVHLPMLLPQTGHRPHKVAFGKEPQYNIERVMSWDFHEQLP